MSEVNDLEYWQKTAESLKEHNDYLRNQINEYTKTLGDIHDSDQQLSDQLKANQNRVINWQQRLFMLQQLVLKLQPSDHVLKSVSGKDSRFKKYYALGFTDATLHIAALLDKAINTQDTLE